MRPVAPVSAVLAALLVGASSSSAPVAARSMAPVGGCRVFPANNYWHANVSRLHVDARSRTWLSHMSTDRNLHPDFGPSYGDGPNYGMPITVVTGSHPRVRVRFEYADESDQVRYPLGDDTKIEGGRNSGGDMHAVVVDKTHCKLFETYYTRYRNGRWSAGSGAVWSLTSNRLRPDTWTSADAAGLPILPGLLRWREVRDDTLDHAIRFTTDVTSNHHLWPARHHAGATDSWAYPPMGARFRLAASFPTAGYGKYARVVIAAMKKYGLVLADNGSPWYFQGERNAAWPPSFVEQLKRIPASAFVAVDTTTLKASNDSAAVKP